MTVSAVILAAGKGTRMNSDIAKVLHEVHGRAMVSWVLDACRAAGCDQQVVVVGHQREAVRAVIAADDVATAVQDQQLGTGHAVLVSEEVVSGDVVLVCCGDAPLVPADLLQQTIQRHRSQGHACTAVAARMSDPTGYGRMITDANGQLLRIVEQRDANPAEAAVNLINSGIYAFDREALFSCLHQLRPDNSQGEYYLTDVPKLLAAEGSGVGLVISDQPDRLLGVNTPKQLAEVAALAKDLAKDLT